MQASRTLAWGLVMRGLHGDQQALTHLEDHVLRPQSPVDTNSRTEGRIEGRIEAVQESLRLVVGRGSLSFGELALGFRPEQRAQISQGGMVPQPLPQLPQAGGDRIDQVRALLAPVVSDLPGDSWQHHPMALQVLGPGRQQPTPTRQTLNLPSLTVAAAIHLRG